MQQQTISHALNCTTQLYSKGSTSMLQILSTQIQILLNHLKCQIIVLLVHILQYVSFNKFNISSHQTVDKSAKLHIILLDFPNCGMYSHIIDLFLPLKEIKSILLLWLHFDITVDCNTVIVVPRTLSVPDIIVTYVSPM